MHPDPSICRVGATSTWSSSSFEYFPGVPIFHSRDLVHLAAARPRADARQAARPRGVAERRAASTRRRCATTTGRSLSSRRRSSAATSSSPRGARAGRGRIRSGWTATASTRPCCSPTAIHLTRDGKGADPDHPRVYQAQLDQVAERAALREPRHAPIWRGKGGIWPEGRARLRWRGDLLPVRRGGRTSYDHSVVVARGRTPSGPFARSRARPLVTHRDRPRHPIQATGHADIVELADGSTWAVLLGVRAPDSAGTTWAARRSWSRSASAPTAGPALPQARAARWTGPPLARRASVAGASEHVDFASARLPPSLVFVRNPARGSWSLRERPGFLRLWGHGGVAG